MQWFYEWWNHKRVSSCTCFVLDMDSPMQELRPSCDDKRWVVQQTPRLICLNMWWERVVCVFGSRHSHPNEWSLRMWTAETKDCIWKLCLVFVFSISSSHQWSFSLVYSVYKEFWFAISFVLRSWQAGSREIILYYQERSFHRSADALELLSNSMSKAFLGEWR